MTLIIREDCHTYALIEQHHHAWISRNAVERLRDERLYDDERYNSILYAVEHHDRGWRMFDQQPFWNDASQSPYSFTDFPTLAKTVLYRHGVDEVEEADPYAALLCSEHYCRFMNNNPLKEAEEFVRREKERQKRIIDSLKNFNKASFQRHYELLKFADNMSLYICLNNPGTTKENEHVFFKSGIPVSESIIETTEGKLQSRWENEGTIGLEPFPFDAAFSVTVREKYVKKSSIAAHGVLESYERTSYEDRKVIIEAMNSGNKEVVT